MRADKVTVGKEVTLRHARTPVLCSKVTLPKGTAVEIDALGNTRGAFWAKVTQNTEVIRFLLDCSDVDE